MPQEEHQLQINTISTRNSLSPANVLLARSWIILWCHSHKSHNRNEAQQSPLDRLRHPSSARNPILSFGGKRLPQVAQTPEESFASARFETASAVLRRKLNECSELLANCLVVLFFEITIMSNVISDAKGVSDRLVSLCVSSCGRFSPKAIACLISCKNSFNRNRFGDGHNFNLRGASAGLF